MYLLLLSLFSLCLMWLSRNTFEIIFFIYSLKFLLIKQCILFMSTPISLQIPHLAFFLKSHSIFKTISNDPLSPMCCLYSRRGGAAYWNMAYLRPHPPGKVMPSTVNSSSNKADHWGPLPDPGWLDGVW